MQKRVGRIFAKIRWEDEMTQIIDGKQISAEIKDELKEQVAVYKIGRASCRERV